MLRNPHPKVYQKIKKTKALMTAGVIPEKFEEKGGLSLENYRSILKIIESRQDSLKDFVRKNEVDDFQQLRSSASIVRKKSVIGSRNALVLLVDFEDKEKITPAQHYQELLFSLGTVENGSMREYYREVSWNQLDINGVVSGWFRADQEYSNYVDEGHTNTNTQKWKMPKAQKLVKEVVDKAIQSHNLGKLSNFDSNGNGKLDNLIIIHSGHGAERTGDMSNIWPHHDKLKKPIHLSNDLIIDRYVLMHEIPSYDLGGFCHEMAHSLGLPDLYQPDFSCMVVGRWCLMGIGCSNNDGRTPAHLSAWCKVRMGWVKPEKITEYNIHDLPVVNDPNKKIYKFDVNGSNGREYFLVENRQQIGFDRFIPGNGLLIWHVDEDRAIDYFPNCNPKHPFLTLEQADGKNELETRVIKSKKLQSSFEDLIGNAGDAYPGDTNNRTFNNKSNPNSNSYMGKVSCVNINSISDSGNLMTAEMGIQCDKSSKSNFKDKKPILMSLKFDY